VTRAEAARLNGRKGGRPRRRPPAPPLDNPFHLTARELLFVEAYCGAARFSASRAYQLAGYRTTGSGGRSNACKLLAKHRVAEAIAGRLAARVERLQVMDGDEALERLTRYARADIGKVLGPHDPIAQLPDDIRLTIHRVRDTQFGRVIELYDAMKATELLAKAAGKLVEQHKHTITLEDIVAGADPEGAVA